MLIYFVNHVFVMCDVLSYIILLNVKAGTTKKKTRGPTRCLQIYAREYCEDVTLDNEGDIIGPNDKTVTDVGNFLGTITRNSTLCPLIYTNFKDFLKEKEDKKTRKERLWIYINVWEVKFHTFSIIKSLSTFDDIYFNFFVEEVQYC